MFLNQKKWGDIDWCDRNIKARSLSDEDVIEAARKVHAYSFAMADLLYEARKRRLVEVVSVAREQVSNGDPEIATPAAGVLEDLGDVSDVPALLVLVDVASHHYFLAALLGAIVVLDPSKSKYALNVAGRGHDDEYFDDDYVMASVIKSVSERSPDNFPDLEGRLLDWAIDARLSSIQRESVYRRLAACPRTQGIEDFLVEFCVRNEGAYPDLTEIVDEALREPSP